MRAEPGYVPPTPDQLDKARGRSPDWPRSTRPRRQAGRSLRRSSASGRNGRRDRRGASCNLLHPPNSRRRRLLGGPRSRQRSGRPRVRPRHTEGDGIGDGAAGQGSRGRRCQDGPSRDRIKVKNPDSPAMMRLVTPAGAFHNSYNLISSPALGGPGMQFVLLIVTGLAIAGTATPN
jgi:hypothetical protein